ncbi:MAG: tetratricopeptide repeat protein [Sulfuricaulis sp.]|nr:tetratricopeptide repeat protein [Sulfuricaulis sp.]
MRRILRIVLFPLTLAFPFSAYSEPATLDVPMDSGQLQKMVIDYNRRIAVNPDDADAYLKRGEAHFKLQEFDKAIEDFSAAIRRNDRLDDAYFGRGMALGRRGQITEGIADLSVYLQRHPDSSLAYTKRGVRYIWIGDLENAEKDLKRAIALDARNAEAHDDLGVILAQRADYAAAISHFQSTLNTDPSYQKAYHNLAMVYYITGENQKALSSVDRGLKLIFESRDSMLLKAAILESLGRHGEAKTAREEAEFMPEGNRRERAAVQ